MGPLHALLLVFQAGLEAFQKAVRHQQNLTGLSCLLSHGCGLDGALLERLIESCGPRCARECLLGAVSTARQVGALFCGTHAMDGFRSRMSKNKRAMSWITCQGLSRTGGMEPDRYRETRARRLGSRDDDAPPGNECHAVWLQEALDADLAPGISFGSPLMLPWVAGDESSIQVGGISISLFRLTEGRGGGRYCVWRRGYRLGEDGARLRGEMAGCTDKAELG